MFITKVQKWRVKTYKRCLKAHLKLQTKLLLYSKYRKLSIGDKIILFSVIAKYGHLCIMAEIEKEDVGFPVLCYLVAREFSLGHSRIFLLFTLLSCIKKIVQSCTYVGLSGCSTSLYQANSSGHGQILK